MRRQWARAGHQPQTLLARLRQSPTYIARITGMRYDEFVEKHTGESPHTGALLLRFVKLVMNGV